MNKIIFGVMCIFTMGACVTKKQMNLALVNQESALKKEFTDKMAAQIKATKDSIKNRNIILYKQAVELKDIYNALNYAFALANSDASNNNWYDTLANLYYLGNNSQACLAALEKLPSTKLDKPRKAMMASCYTNLGKYSEAIYILEEFAKNSTDIKDYYQLAKLQMQTGRIAEAEANLNRCLGLKDNELTDAMQIPEAQGQTQDVKIKAVVWYYYGLLQLNKQPARVEDAKICFNKALEIQKDFYLAQAYLMEISKPSSGAGRPSGK